MLYLKFLIVYSFSQVYNQAKGKLQTNNKDDNIHISKGQLT